MQKRLRLFGRLLLGHFALTVLTGLLWTALMSAVDKSHHAPAVLAIMYASFWLFVPFCQPFFWPMSDWVARSGHFNLFHSSWPLELTEYLVIAFLNSLSAVILLFGAVGLVQFARRHPRKQTES